MLRYVVMSLVVGAIALSVSCSSTTNVSGLAVPARDVASTGPAQGAGSGNDVMESKGTSSTGPAQGAGSGNDVMSTGPAQGAGSGNDVMSTP